MSALGTLWRVEASEPLSPAPVLTDGRITLRPHTVADVPAVVEMCTDPATLAWTTVPRPYDEVMAVDYLAGFVASSWADGSDLTWAVSARDDDGTERFAGNLSVRPGPPVDLGYSLHPWARGRGVMSAAVRLGSRWAFDELAAEVVQWQCEAGNLDSWRVAWACGFTFTGEEPLRLPGWDGRLRDSWRAVLRPGEPMDTPRTRWLVAPVLDAGSCVLRPLRADDVTGLTESADDPDTRFWLPFISDPFDGAAFIRDRELAMSRDRVVAWALADPVDDRFLGQLTIFDLTNHICPGSGEIGYWTHPPARGRGLMTAAVRAVSEWALDPAGLGLHRLLISTSWGNTASRRVAEANGYAFVGHHRRDGLAGDGSYEDGAFYDRLAPGLAASHPD